MAASLFVVAAVAAIVGVVAWSNRPGHSDVPLLLGAGTSSPTTYHLEVAATPQQQAKGLGDRASLANNGGMLFPNGSVTESCMWMKDMHFNIDIVWFDASHRITSIVPNLSPKTYPQNYCADAQYVVELPAGAAAAHGLRVGQVVSF